MKQKRTDGSLSEELEKLLRTPDAELLEQARRDGINVEELVKQQRAYIQKRLDEVTERPPHIDPPISPTWVNTSTGDTATASS